mmetsp:Transcript_47418/g.78594  ORF Transcript_47418/g.78594 Transcript_47418/m.78594 type:complete len:567 (-) Transcript_47418:327-2027(-)
MDERREGCSPEEENLSDRESKKPPFAAGATRASRPFIRALSERTSDSVVSDWEVETPTASPLKGPLPQYSRRKRQLWKVARSPWYNTKGTRVEPLVIGVTGGTASGKTTVCRKIIDKLGIPWVVLLSMDRFYRNLTPAEHKIVEAGKFNWDHPSAFDWPLFQKTIAAIRSGRSVDVPRYDFSTNSREKKKDTVYGADIVIIEGILVLHDKPLRELMDIKVFVDTDSDLRLARRIKRDIRERGRKLDDILAQYVKTVKPSFDDYIFPTKRYADLIVPRGGDNYVAINLLVQHVKAVLKQRGLLNSRDKFKKRMRFLNVSKDKLIQLLPKTVTILTPTPMLRAAHTVLRDNNTSCHVFRHASHRVGRLLIAEALGVSMGMSSARKAARSPRKSLFQDDESFHLDKEQSASETVTPPLVFGVSIVRGGQAIEHSLREIVPEVKIGKMIIAQSIDKSDGPRLYYCRFPRNLDTAPVLLMDPVISTSNTCEMALRILLDHGVEESQIILCCIIAAPQGLLSISRNFPKVRIVCSWVDQGLNEKFFVIPGLGYFGARYFNCSEVGLITAGMK